MLTVCAGLLVAGLALIGFVTWAVITDNSSPRHDPQRREFYRRLYEAIDHQQGEPQ